MQIGPKIRVGGTIGKIGQNVKNAVTKGVTDVGHAVGDVAKNPLTQGLTAALLAATGVGAPAAAAIMAGLKGGGTLLAPGGNLGKAAAGGLSGAALGGLAGMAGNALYGGLGTIGSGSGALGGVANAGGSILDYVKKGLTGSLNPTGGFAGGTPGALTAGAPGAGGFDWTKLLGLAGTAAAGVKGYQDASAAGAKRDAYLGKQAGIADEQATLGRGMLADATPIRKASESAFTNLLATAPRGVPDLSGLTDTANPFASKFRPAVPPPPSAPAPGSSPALVGPPVATIDLRSALPGPTRQKRLALPAGAAA